MTRRNQEEPLGYRIVQPRWDAYPISSKIFLLTQKAPAKESTMPFKLSWAERAAWINDCAPCSQVRELSMGFAAHFFMECPASCPRSMLLRYEWSHRFTSGKRMIILSGALCHGVHAHMLKLRFSLGNIQAQFSGHIIKAADCHRRLPI